MLAAPTAPAQNLDVPVGAVISHVEGDLDAIREALRDLEAAPEGGRFTIWDKESYQADLDGYLDDAFALVAPEVYPEHKARLNAIEEAIAEARIERSALLVEQLGAAPAAGGPSLLDQAMGREHPQGSREDVDTRLRAVEGAISGHEAEREAVVRSFREALREQFGIELTSEQARAALYQVNGASMVESAVAAEVLAAVEQRLKTIVEQDLAAEAAQRYYGVAAVTRLIIVRMHERHLSSYDETWLPRLDELEADNRALVEETTRLRDAAASEARRAAFEANLDVQRQIADAMERYRDVLLERRERTQASLFMAREDAEVAVNTLKTLESAVQLSGVMTQSLEEFTRLMSVDAPTLLPLDDEAMFERFLDISRQIEGTS